MPVFLQVSALGRRFNPDIEEIRRALAGLAVHHPVLAPLLMLFCQRLHDTLARLDRLADRWRRNRHLPRASRAREREPRRAPLLRTPQGHAWLLRLHQPLAQWAPRIQKILDDPELIGLCAAAPQAGRLLRPLCRAFGLTPPPHVARPGRPRRPRPAPPEPSPPPFAEHSPAQWPYVPLRLRLRVPGLCGPARRRPKPPH